jgi:hypothetical protein
MSGFESVAMLGDRHQYPYLFRRLAHSIRQPEQRRHAWAAMRADGRYWMGPYRYQGRTFTDVPRQAYLWGSRQAAETMLLWDGWHGITVVEVDVAVFGRMKRRRRR